MKDRWPTLSLSDPEGESAVSGQKKIKHILLQFKIAQPFRPEFVAFFWDADLFWSILDLSPLFVHSSVRLELEPRTDQIKGKDLVQTKNQHEDHKFRLKRAGHFKIEILLTS